MEVLQLDREAAEEFCRLRMDLFREIGGALSGNGRPGPGTGHGAVLSGAYREGFVRLGDFFRGGSCGLRRRSACFRGSHMREILPVRRGICSASIRLRSTGGGGLSGRFWTGCLRSAGSGGSGGCGSAAATRGGLFTLPGDFFPGAGRWSGFWNEKRRLVSARRRWV